MKATKAAMKAAKAAMKATKAAMKARKAATQKEMKAMKSKWPRGFHMRWMEVAEEVEKREAAEVAASAARE